MTTLYRTRVTLNGWQGGPGVNTFIWSQGTLPEVAGDEVSSWHQDIADAYVAVRQYLCDGLVFQVQPEVDVLDSATGNITGVLVATGGAVGDTAGTSQTSALSRATQAIVSTKTDVWQGGRRLQGRIFLGPIAADAFTETGQFSNTFMGNVENAFGALNTGLGPRWAVYHRPRGSADGYYGDIVNVTCRPYAGNLKSRR